MKRLMSLLLMVVLLATIRTVYSQNRDKDEILKRVKDYEDAYNKGDAKSTAAVYANDGYHTYASGITHIGRTDIEQGLAESFEGPMKGTQVKLISEDIQFLTPDIAYERESFLLSGAKMPNGNAIPTIKGYCLGIYQKQDGEWYIKGMQCMVPLIPPK